MEHWTLIRLCSYSSITKETIVPLAEKKKILLGTYVSDIVLVFLWLTLHIILIFFQCFYCYFEQVNDSWVAKQPHLFYLEELRISLNVSCTRIRVVNERKTISNVRFVQT